MACALARMAEGQPVALAPGAGGLILASRLWKPHLDASGNRTISRLSVFLASDDADG